MNKLSVINKQHLHRIGTTEFQEVARIVIEDLLNQQLYDLSVTFLNPERMAEVNMKHLEHRGPTDIITFDYSSESTLEGELLICPSVADEHSRQHNVSLGNELARYYIHGILHLLGYNDKNPNERRKMKHKETFLLRQLAELFPLEKLVHE
jgi:probable rRNA maturation factor